MNKPWEISADDIELWARRMEAASVLPKLIRRLLLATVPLDGLQMRADAGIRYGGWDGLVRARTEGPFCPAGVSVWEMSTELSVRAKLNEDFEKRTKDPGEIVAPQSSYVAVSAHRFEKKDAWVREKKQLKQWADIWVFDADDLSAWLEQAPGVALWFAEQLGRATDACELQDYLKRWSARTSPPLPSSLVMVGQERQAQAAKLVQWASDLGSKRCFIQADTQEEAALFATEALSSREWSPWAEQALVVETPETFVWLTRPRRGESILVIPVFEMPDIGRAAGVPVRLLLPVGRSATPPERETLNLKPQSYPELIEELVKHGRERREAERLVLEAGGSLTVLQQICGYFVRPDWARDLSRPALVAFLLMGAWSPLNSSDREVVQRLGANAEELERWCAHMISGPWVEQIQGRGQPVGYRWRAMAGAWKVLGPKLGALSSWWQEYLKVATDVLGELNPAFDLPKEQRIFVPNRQYSEGLRHGMAGALICCALQPDIPKAEDLAFVVVRDVLDIQRGWKAWASATDILPDLAEASPRAFLEALEKSLDKGDEGAAHLFAEEGRIVGGAPHTGLLWALERIAWSKDFGVVQGTVFALARLCEVDREGYQPGKRFNRPQRSLTAMLDRLAPQSNTTVEQRIQLLKLLCQRHSDVAWTILNDIFGALKDMHLLHQGARPIFRSEGPTGRFNEATPNEAGEQLRTSYELWLAYAGTDAGRWADMLEPARRLPENERIRVLDTLAQRADSIQDSEAKIWSELRRQLDLFYRSNKQSESILDRLKNLYERFKPSDVVLQVAWLFDKGIDLPEPIDESGVYNLKKRVARNDELAQEAMAQILSRKDAWDTLARLAQRIQLPNELGKHIAKSPSGASWEEQFLHPNDVGSLAGVVPTFLVWRAFEHGDRTAQVEWLKTVWKRLIGLGRGEEAAASAQLLNNKNTIFPRAAELWDVIDLLGEPLKTAHWNRFRYVFSDVSDPDLTRAIRELVSVGRIAQAIELASMYSEKISGKTALLALEALKSNPSGEALKSIQSYMIRTLFEVLDRDPHGDIHQIAELELPLLAYLDDDGSNAKRPLVLGKMLGSAPDFFVQLLCYLYHAEGEPRPDEPDPKAKNAAKHGHRVLWMWKGYPGEEFEEAAREDAVEAWCRAVFKLATEERRGAISIVNIAEVLARVPPPSNGHWPCIAARRLLEERAFPDLDRHLQTAEWNRLNGEVHTMSSERERELQEHYQDAAEALRDEYPRTAALLDELARCYKSSAEREEREEEERRVRYGEGESKSEPEPAPPPLPSSTAQAGPLSRLETHHIGPSSELIFDFAPRLNLLTGDNSLGKTFVLDIIFWVLTGEWPPGHAMVRPEPPKRKAQKESKPQTPSIVAQAGQNQLHAIYDFKKARWSPNISSRLGNSLVMYARADGGISIWDPLRNSSPSRDNPNAIPCFHFGGRPAVATSPASPQDTGDSLWDGLKHNGKPICNGLIIDVVSWRDRKPEAFEKIQKALKALSPDQERFQLDAPKRIARDDSREHPRLLLPYGPIFAVHASAAVKRVLGLAYALVWSVMEINEAAQQMGVKPPSGAVLLVDELEAHLHPRWQRTILRSVIEAAKKLLPEAPPIQLMISTHSPLVIASAEDVYDEEKDALFHFDALENGLKVRVEKKPWTLRGEADAWLLSDVFGLPSTRSVEAQKALDKAKQAMNNGDLDAKTAREIHQELRTVLSELDPFWTRWRYIAEKRGWIT